MLILTLALDRDLALTSALNYSDRNVLHGDVRVHIRDLDSAIHLAHALDYALALAGDLNLNLVRDRHLVHNLTLVRDRSRGRDRAFVLSRHHARDLDRAIIRDRNRALEFQETKIFKFNDFQTLTEQLQALQLDAPSEDASDRVRQEFRDRIFQLWRNALRLNPDLLELSEEEITNLTKYLYANQLLIRCKEASVRVTESVWAGIEARMLKVRNQA